MADPTTGTDWVLFDDRSFEPVPLDRVADPDLPEGTPVILTYDDPNTGTSMPVAGAVVGYVGTQLGASVDRYGVRVLREGIGSLPAGTVVGLPRSKVARATDVVPPPGPGSAGGGAPPPPAPKPKGGPTPGPLSSAGKVLGGPVVWLGLGAIAFFMLRGHRE